MNGGWNTATILDQEEPLYPCHCNNDFLPNPAYDDTQLEYERFIEQLFPFDNDECNIRQF